jgi:hypothetical protein
MRRRQLALVILVALLAAGELRYATTAAAEAPSDDDESPEPPPPPPQEDDESPPPPQAPGPPRRPRRRAPPPPPPKEAGGGQQEPPAPPRLVVPPQQDPAGSNRTGVQVGCTTLLVFGDSTVDPGNNNRLQTAARANFLPYGLNFFGGMRPTGRFTNGRLATDMIAERLGIARTVPGFLDANLRLVQLRTGVSFASGGSGYDDNTANRLVCV